MPTIDLGRVKGEDGRTPIIQVGTVTALEADENPTVTATTEDITTTFDFGIPRGKDTTSIFTGTTAEYEASIDIIEDGTVVNLTDDGLDDGSLIGVDTLNRVTALEDGLDELDADVVKKSDILTTMEQVSANTNDDAVPSANVVKELNSSLSTKLDSSKILLSETPQMRFGVYSNNPDDYDIDFRRNETTIIKFRFHITNSNVDVFESTDNGITWTHRRNGDTFLQ